MLHSLVLFYFLKLSSIWLLFWLLRNIFWLLIGYFCAFLWLLGSGPMWPHCGEPYEHRGDSALPGHQFGDYWENKTMEGEGKLEENDRCRHAHRNNPMHELVIGHICGDESSKSDIRYSLLLYAGLSVR